MTGFILFIFIPVLGLWTPTHVGCINPARFLRKTFVISFTFYLFNCWKENNYLWIWGKWHHMSSSALHHCGWVMHLLHQHVWSRFQYGIFPSSIAVDLGLKAPTPFLKMKNTRGQISNVLYFICYVSLSVFCIAVGGKKEYFIYTHTYI